MSKTEWEKCPGDVCVCACFLFSPTPTTKHSYSSAEEPAAGKASKIRREKFSLTRGTVL